MLIIHDGDKVYFNLNNSLNKEVITYDIEYQVTCSIKDRPLVHAFK